MKFTRRGTLTTLAGALAMPWVRPSWAQAGTVNVYNWADYIGETTIQDFESETGIGVTYDLYASSEEAEAKMLVGGTGYDVVLQSGLSLSKFIAAGVYQPMDHARLTGWGNLDPRILEIVNGFDPGHRYTVPYMWGSVGFAFNLDLVNERLPGADLDDMSFLMDPANATKLADCGISLLDSPTDAGFLVLRYLGIDTNTAGKADYDRMVEALKPVRQYITTFDNNGFLTTMPNGELCVVNSWSGDYSTVKTRAAEAGIEMNLAYHVPKTGAPAWFDLWAIPSDAPHVENAYRFIDYLLRPEVIAACTNFTGYANANKEATKFVDPEFVNDPAVYPDEATLARLYTPAPMTEEQERDLLRAWQMFKTGG